MQAQYLIAMSILVNYCDSSRFGILKVSIVLVSIVFYSSRFRILEELTFTVQSVLFLRNNIVSKFMQIQIMDIATALEELC